ncbi:uncharacterized protein DS421_1g30210 [Arachis hypogaea]|nr:uncharacterized protein DS421_1g30210 [Arachis hypogaea]
MGDTGLPPVPILNESISIRSPTALPSVPAPQRNTRKLAKVAPTRDPNEEDSGVESD